MRRKDREMDESFGWLVLDKSKYAVLSMTLPDGTPYCLPLSVARLGKTLYFHCAKEGQKTTALKSNPQVCLTAVGSVNPLKNAFTTEYESVVVFGKAEEVEDEGQKIEALRAICEKYTPDNMLNFDEATNRSMARVSIWKIVPTEVTAKRKKYDKQGVEMKYGRME